MAARISLLNYLSNWVCIFSHITHLFALYWNFSPVWYVLFLFWHFWFLIYYFVDRFMENLICMHSQVLWLMIHVFKKILACLHNNSVPWRYWPIAIPKQPVGFTSRLCTPSNNNLIYIVNLILYQHLLLKVWISKSVSIFIENSSKTTKI